MCLRGFPTVSAALTPASVAANTSAEQQFSLAPTPPVATAVINSSGQVTAINFTSSGSGYIVPPTVVIAGGGYTTTPQDIQSGTATGIGGNTAQYTAAAPGGSGATAVAVIGSTGTVASSDHQPGTRLPGRSGSLLCGPLRRRRRGWLWQFPSLPRLPG